MGSIIVHTLSKALTKVVYNSAGHFNEDPVALKLITHNKIMFRAGTGSSLPRLKCKQNALCVAVTDSLVLIRNGSAMLTSSIHGSNWKRNEKQWHYKETKQNGIIWRKIALFVPYISYVLFENKNTFLFLYFICISLNLQMSQINLPDPVFPECFRGQQKSVLWVECGLQAVNFPPLG